MPAETIDEAVSPVKTDTLGEDIDNGLLKNGNHGDEQDKYEAEKDQRRREEPDKEEGKVELKRSLNLFHGVAIIMGLVIGSGIYIAPKGAFMQVRSPGVVLLLWVGGAVSAILGALTFAELGTTIPRSGAMYAYLDEILGPFPAFLQLWQYLFLTRPAANVAKCIVFGQYIIKPFFKDCPVPDSVVAIFAILLACGVTFVNCRNVKSSAKLQMFCTSMSVVALLIVVIVGGIYMGKGNTEYLENAFSGASDADIGSLAVAMYFTQSAYGGLYALNFMTEELQNPYKNLPRAIVISVSVITVLYVSANIAYVGVLGVDGIIASDAVAVSTAQTVMGPAVWIIVILICINTSGSLNSGILVGSRLGFAGARRGHLPKFMAMIHVHRMTPITALSFQLLIMVLIALTADLYAIYRNTVFVNIFFDALSGYACIYLRWKEPQRHRPIKVPLLVLLGYTAAQSLLVIVPLFTQPRATAMGMLLVLGTGIPYYLIFVLNIINTSSLNSYCGKFTLIVQKLMMCVKPED